jgi:hypothetical protein
MSAGSSECKVRTEKTAAGRIVATYDYVDEGGKLVYQKVRYHPKDFKQRRPDGNGGWIWSVKGVRWVLYRLRELHAVHKSRAVVYVEGEKDADALWDIDVPATTHTHSSNEWQADYSESFRGRLIIVIADNDEPGRKHAQYVAERLRGIAASVRILHLPGVPENGGDVSDWLAILGNDKQRLLELADRAPVYGKKEETNGWHPIESDEPALSIDDATWPAPLHTDALGGLAGDFVRIVEPASEADSAGLLIQFLVGFGSMAGRKAHFRVDGTNHYTNEFAVLVGDTSKGRKGTAWNRVRNILAGADPDWVRDRVQSGLSSGEGLIYAVRDRVMSRERIKDNDKGRPPEYQDVETDPGVSDKRLLTFEPEFSNVLRQAERQGNTVSVIIRQAWESGDLRTMTKNSPTRSTGAHVGIIGHCTIQELRKYLTATEAANGFANRFLFTCVRRSKLLPFGGHIDDKDAVDLENRTHNALGAARLLDLMELDKDARDLWRDVYPELSEGRPGLTGALLGRAEAHTMRLALLYALLDAAPAIRAVDLLAGLAVWRYCKDSVAYIFGEDTGHPLADEILPALKAAKEKGLTRRDLSALFNRNKTSLQISRALKTLLAAGLTHYRMMPTAGRSAETWYYGTKETNFTKQLTAKEFTPNE